MKKFWTVLALVAFALNMSAASLWAQEMKTETATPVVADQVKDDEAKLAETSLTADESLAKADETTTGAVVPAVKTEEKKKESSEASVAVPAAGEAKVS